MNLTLQNPTQMANLTIVPDHAAPARALTGIFMIAFMGLIGCVGVSLPSSEEMIAASYLTIETLAESTQVAYEAQEIDDATRQEVRGQLQIAQNATNMARQFLDTADSVHAMEALNGAFAAIEVVRALLPTPGGEL